MCTAGSLKSDVRGRFGWWRPSPTSLGMTPCIFPAACLGNSTSDPALRFRYPIGKQEHAERCNEEWGHQQTCGGRRCRLCATCRRGFKRFGHGRCRECPAATNNRLLLAGGFLLTVGALVALVWMAMGSAGSETSLADAVRKLIINYLQVSALAAGFPLDWPGPMEVLFELQGSISTAGEHLLSPDCELSVIPAAEAFYTKQVAYAFAPLFVCGASFALWRCIACARGEPWRGERLGVHRADATATTPKDRAVLTLILLLYMIYPTICQQTLSVLSCRQVGDWQYLSADLEEPCWRDRHLAYALGLAAPQVVLYVFGLPFLAAYMMYRNRDRMTDHVVHFRYGMLYSGYRVERYYWEVLVAMRKAFIIILSTFGSLIRVRVQTHLALLLLMAALVLHAGGKPFVAPSLQQLEAAGLVTCWFTMWCGLLFYQEGLSQTMGVLITVVIVSVNTVYMVVIGVFLVYHTLKEQASARRCRCLRGMFERAGVDVSVEDQGSHGVVELASVHLDGADRVEGTQVNDEDWTQHYSVKHGIPFYHNRATGEVTWEKPGASK